MASIKMRGFPMAVYAEWVMALLIGAACASAWRGGWQICDSLLLPQDPLQSALVSVAVGGMAFIFLVAVQPRLAACARAHSGLRLWWVADALYTYSGGWASILWWRGVWQLWDCRRGLIAAGTVDYEHALDALLSHAAGCLLLLLLGATRNIVAPPMLISCDSSDPIFGAGRTVGLEAICNPLIRLRQPPSVQSERDWCDSVGVPFLARERRDKDLADVVSDPGEPSSPS